MDAEQGQPLVQVTLTVPEAQALLDEPRPLHEGAAHHALYRALAQALLEAGVATVEAPMEQ